VPRTPITQEIVRFAAAAIDRVVTTAGVGDDSKQRRAAIGMKHCADPNIDVALHLDRIGGAIAVAAISGVEAQKIDRLLALQIDEPEDFAAPDNLSPRPSGRHNLVENDEFA
jgi:hypothetical protein